MCRQRLRTNEDAGTTEEADRKAKEEADRKANDEAEHKAKEEADGNITEERILTQLRDISRYSFSAELAATPIFSVGMTYREGALFLCSNEKEPGKQAVGFWALGRSLAAQETGARERQELHEKDCYLAALALWTRSRPMHGTNSGLCWQRERARQRQEVYEGRVSPYDTSLCIFSEDQKQTLLCD
jgi:hypothetical protein